MDSLAKVGTLRSANSNNQAQQTRALPRARSLMPCVKSKDCIQKFILKHVRSSDCALDFGAHKGRYTAVMAQSVGENGVVPAFEPNPELNRSLTANASTPNVHIHNLAVSDSVGRKRFYIDARDGLDGVASSLEVL